MPDKFENATLLLRLGLPSRRLYPHKKIHGNGTFWKRFPEWNNLKRYFFVLVWTENFLYPQGFSNTLTSFCHVIYLPKYFNMEKNMIFYVLLTIFIFFNRLRRAKYCFITPAHKE